MEVKIGVQHSPPRAGRGDRRVRRGRRELPARPPRRRRLHADRHARAARPSSRRRDLVRRDRRRRLPARSASAAHRPRRRCSSATCCGPCSEAPSSGILGKWLAPEGPRRGAAVAHRALRVGGGWWATRSTSTSTPTTPGFDWWRHGWQIGRRRARHGRGGGLRRGGAADVGARVAVEGRARPSAAVPLGQPGEHPPDRRQVQTGAVDPAGQQRRERVAVGRDPLRLDQRLPHQPPAPERQPAAEPVVRGDRRAHPVDDERDGPVSSREATTRSRCRGRGTPRSRGRSRRRARRRRTP